MTKYLSEKEIRELIGDIKVSPDFQPMSQDSYNETLIGHAIEKTGKKTELLEATINIAIVGVGNKRYGNYRKGDNVIEIGTLLQNSGVRLRLPQATVLKEDELTIGRLCRFFRHFIRQYIRESGYTSYLYRKYSNHSKEMREILFRGAEYLEDLSPDQLQYLRGVYNTMDLKLNTSFVEKFDRIQQAKTGVLPKEERG